LSLILVCAACGAHSVRSAPFRARPDSIAAGDLRGPFDGVVVDAETDRPVAGALVYAAFSFVRGYGLSSPAGWHEHVGTTDAEGRYRVPRLSSLPANPSIRLSDVTILIYKRGYVAYRSDRRFGDLSQRLDFSQTQHRVVLDRWRSDLSHVKHLRYVGGGPTLSTITAWEIPEAAAELAGKPSDLPRATGPTPVLLVVDAFLVADDVREVTSYTGSFAVADVAGEPTTPEYDSVHLRAESQEGDTHDVALRMWKTGLPQAQAQYGALLKELPGVKEQNELGDRSFRATSQDGNVLAVGFLLGKSGVVALVTCGTAQCHGFEALLALTQRVKDRIAAAIPEER
jgi:hypothetical protein